MIIHDDNKVTVRKKKFRNASLIQNLFSENLTGI